MRKIKFLVMLGFLCVISLKASAYDFESGGIYYDITSSSNPYTVEVTSGGSDYSGAVNIPASVTYNNMTYSVTSIG